MTKTIERTQASKVVYRRGNAHAKAIAPYIELIAHPDREFMRGASKRALARYMREDVTAREAQCLELYYVQQFNYRQISAQLNIGVSTISRNIQRGEQKISRVLSLARDICGEGAL